MKCDTCITRPISKCAYIFSDGEGKQNKTDIAHLRIIAAIESKNIQCDAYKRFSLCIPKSVIDGKASEDLYCQHDTQNSLLWETELSWYITHQSQMPTIMNSELSIELQLMVSDTACPTAARLVWQSLRQWEEKKEQPSNLQIQPNPWLWSMDGRGVIVSWVSHR